MTELIIEEPIRLAAVTKDMAIGPRGKSAFQLALDNGYQGTVEEWISSLKGVNGLPGKSTFELAVEIGFDGSLEEWMVILTSRTTIDVTYSELMSIITLGNLMPGEKYKITDFSTVHWLVDGHGNYAQEILVSVDARISDPYCVPDAVGDNPYPLYVTAIAHNNRTMKRSHPTTEMEIICGDSTTQIIFNCTIPDGCDMIDVWIYPESGNQISFHDDGEGSSGWPQNYLPMNLMGRYNDGGNMYNSRIQNYSILQVVDSIKMVHAGAIEPLIVTAISINKLAPDAYSESYPQDKIVYDFDNNHFLFISAFFDPVTRDFVEQLKGVIVSREDTLTGNKTSFDFREITYPVWTYKVPEWVPNVTYYSGNVVARGDTNDGGIYGCKNQSANINPGVTTGWESYWELLIPAPVLTFNRLHPGEITIKGYTLPAIEFASDDKKKMFSESCRDNHQEDRTNLPCIVLPPYSCNNEFKAGVHSPLLLTTITQHSVVHFNSDLEVFQMYLSSDGIVVGNNLINISGER